MDITLYRLTIHPERSRGGEASRGGVEGRGVLPRFRVLMSMFTSQIGNLFITEFQFLSQNLLNDANAYRFIAVQRNNGSLSGEISENMMTAVHSIKNPSSPLQQCDERLPRESRQLRQANRGGWKLTATEERLPRGIGHAQLPQCRAKLLSSNQRWPLPSFYLHRKQQHQVPTLPISSTLRRRKALRRSLVACHYYSIRLALICSHSSTTSRRVFAQVFRVFPVAQTPLKPGILPKTVRLSSMCSNRAPLVMRSTLVITMQSV